MYAQVKEAYILTSEANWHQRMGHIGQNALEMLSKATDGCNIPPGGLIKCKDCETCIKAKATTIVSRKSLNRASEYLEKVYSDIYRLISPKI